MNPVQQSIEQLLNSLSSVQANMTLTGQPEQLLKSLDQAFKELIGHKAITLFSCNCNTGDIVRIYTGGQLTGHPTGGTKNMAHTEWGIKVLEKKEIFIVHTQQEFDRCFPTQGADIAKNNCPSCLTYPVLYNGLCLGAINLLHEEYHYSDEKIEIGKILSPLLLPALMDQTV